MQQASSQAKFELNGKGMLRRADCPWKPHSLANQSIHGAVDEERKQERKVRSLLNKLTPQTFQKLMLQLKCLKLNTEEQLNGTIDIIFDAVLNEPIRSVLPSHRQTYAHMCKSMSDVTVPLTQTPQQLVSFRNLLINRCQKEFKRCLAEDGEQQQDIDASQKFNTTDGASSDRSTAEVVAHMQSLSNIRFVGELLKVKVLVESVVHHAIRQLLDSNSEHSLECTCTLLSSVGKYLDNIQGKARIDEYFARMKRMIDGSGRVSTRVRCLVMNVFELRTRGWLSRHTHHLMPTPIEQAHRQAELELDVTFIEPPVFEFERSRDNPNYLDHAVMDIGALAAMVADDSVDNDAIYSWIKRNVLPDDCDRPEFVHCLTKAVFSLVVQDCTEDTLNVELIKRRGHIFKQFFDSQPKLELHIVYTLQDLICNAHQSPAMFSLVMSLLYDEGFIGDDTYLHFEMLKKHLGRRGDVKSVDDSVCKSSKTWLKRTQRESIVLPEVTLGYAGVTEFTQSLWCEQKVVFHRLMPKDVKMETPEMARGNQLHLERDIEVNGTESIAASNENGNELGASSEEDPWVGMLHIVIASLNLINALEGFLHGKTIAREVHVFGKLFESDFCVFGIVDEIRCSVDLKKVTFLEFKTRQHPSLPPPQQHRTNEMQVMLYKTLFDNLVTGSFDKAVFARQMKFDLHAEFDADIYARVAAAGYSAARTPDTLLNIVTEKALQFPRVSKLEIEYQSQRDKEILGRLPVIHDERWLQSTFHSMASLWVGERRAYGVDIEEGRKCKGCDFAPICELRQADRFVAGAGRWQGQGNRSFHDNRHYTNTSGGATVQRDASERQAALATVRNMAGGRVSTRQAMTSSRPRLHQANWRSRD